MKYIITENKLKQVMVRYLDDYMENNPVSKFDNFIIISQPDQNGEDFYAAIEFDEEDGRLWIEMEFAKHLMDLFGQTLESLQEIIKEWFENKFDVEVLYVQS